MNIRLHIDELVVDGLAVTKAQGPLLRTTVEKELHHLLFSSGLGRAFVSGGTVPSVPGRGFEAAPSASPAQLGTQIAKSIYGGIGNPK